MHINDVILDVIICNTRGIITVITGKSNVIIT